MTHQPQAPSLLSRMLHTPSFMLGAILTVTVATLAALSFFWTPHDALSVNIMDRLKPISTTYWLGTDHFGRDLFSMLMLGARNSIAVALVAVGIGLGIGVPLGTWAAAKGGWVDEILMRSSDFIFAFPALISAIMITALAGPGAINAIISIGIFNIPVFARISRGGALSFWTRDFILAARISGKGPMHITIEHILPNITNLLIVQATIQFSLGILAEAGLSYVGLGTQPPMPSWGQMLFDAQTMIAFAPSLAIIPGMAIIITVLGLNLLGDGLRDIFDPKSEITLSHQNTPEAEGKS